MRVKTTPRFVPGGTAEKEVLVEEFGRLQEKVIAAICAAEGLPIQKVKVASPFAERVHYSLYSTFTILTTHQYRHLGQAERALRKAVRG